MILSKYQSALMGLVLSRPLRRLLTILCLLLVAGCDGAIAPPGQILEKTPAPIIRRTVGIQAGHGNGDSGASFCPGSDRLPGIDSEDDVNRIIANKVANLLSSVEGVNVFVYIGRDSHIRGFKADAFVSLHCDQGKAGVSGYKVSRYGGAEGSGLNGSSDASDKLVQALWDSYGKATGLPKDTSPDHFTDDMRYYYALAWIDAGTPGAVIEMGWLCDDLPILLHHQDDVALGIASGIAEFLGTQIPPALTPPPILVPQPSQPPMIVTVVPATVEQPPPSPTPSGGGTGRIAFTSEHSGSYEIYVMNVDGSDQTNLTNNPAHDHSPAWSPDGTRIAFHSNRSNGNMDIYLMNADGSGLTRLTNNPAYEGWPTWSPDGTRIAFVSYRDDGTGGIYIINADGSGLTYLKNSPADAMRPDWSPDGIRIAFDSCFEHAGNSEIYVMNVDGSGLTRLTNSPTSDLFPAWSPNSAQIAFASYRDGTLDIYVMNADGSGLTQLTNSSMSDMFPAWSPDGMRIAFTSHDADLIGDVCVMNVDSSGLINLTNSSPDDRTPAWQP